MNLTKHNNNLFLILRWISFLLLVLTIGGIEQIYSDLLRVFLFSIFLYGLVLLIKEKNYLFALIYLLMIIIYNPIIPFRLQSELGRTIQILMAIAIMITIAYNEEISSKSADIEDEELTS